MSDHANKGFQYRTTHHMRGFLMHLSIFLLCNKIQKAHTFQWFLFAVNGIKPLCYFSIALKRKNEPAFSVVFINLRVDGWLATDCCTHKSGWVWTDLSACWFGLWFGFGAGCQAKEKYYFVKPYMKLLLFLIWGWVSCNVTCTQIVCLHYV